MRRPYLLLSKTHKQTLLRIVLLIIATFTTEVTTHAIDFTNAKMYSPLLPYRYEPGQRDPYINASIISPFVTKDAPAAPPPAQDNTQKLRDGFANALQANIKIIGTVVGSVGSNYALVDPGGQTVSPGDLLYTPMADIQSDALKSLGDLRLTSNGFIGLKVFQIKENSILLVQPWVEDNTPITDKQLIRIDYVPKKVERFNIKTPAPAGAAQTTSNPTDILKLP